VITCNQKSSNFWDKIKGNSINNSDFLIFITYVGGDHYGYSLRPPKHVATPLVRAMLRPEQIEAHSTIFVLRSFHSAAVRSSHNYEPNSIGDMGSKGRNSKWYSCCLRRVSRSESCSNEQPVKNFVFWFKTLAFILLLGSMYQHPVTMKTELSYALTFQHFSSKYA